MSHDDWRFAFEIAAFLVILASLGAFIFKVGHFAHRIEQAADKVVALEQAITRIPGIEQRLEFLGEWVKRLDGKHDSTRVHAIRAEAISSHDFGEE
jgi:hypothetical protein